MKIECDKCAAKYSIADEKVRGKTFKIRCKKCSNVIIVRDKGAAAAGGGAAAAAADHGPGWHLAINGETVGPMGEDEVRQRYDAGEIDKETAVWQEGFEDWIPLGDVDAFASLPERAPAAAAEDPFTSANQDDYAAPAAAVAMGGGAAMDQGMSPRVSQLTGQRNENSVLFSLDSLQALATGGGGGGGASAAAPSAMAPSVARTAANPSKGLSTSAPSSEGSGLIDIRALGAMVGGAAPAGQGGYAAPHYPADDAALPSFGGSGFGGLASAPLISQSAAIDHAAAVAAAQPHPAPRSQAPLYAMMALLLVAVIGLVVFVVTREPETKIVKETITAPGAAPSVKDDGGDDDAKDDEDDGKGKDDGKDDGDKDPKAAGGSDGSGGAGGSEGELDGGGDDAKSAGGSSTKKKYAGTTKKKSSDPKSSGDGGGDPLAEALGGGDGKKKAAPPPKDAGGGDPGIDCILDASKCGKKAATPKKDKPAGGATDPSLPEKLTSADIKNGVSPHKGAAKQCGAAHGGVAGDKVTIKLSISGATGAVTSATATGKHKGTPLGNCVAAALKKSTFSKFRNASLGVQYPILL